jgi:riboflavin kinase/FMN adenylyltransferase
MEVFHASRSSHRRLGRPAIAIGNFDGVHRGHQELLQLAQSAARIRGGEGVVLTFEPHPARLLAPTLAPPLIYPLERKLELFGEVGMDVCVLEPFTLELARVSAEGFVDQVLCAGLCAEEIVVGYDFTFGKKREGTVETLRQLGLARGFAVHVVPPVTVNGLVASSTKVREFVLEGNVEGARMLLGRCFDVRGRVVQGAGRGRTIGIPTANVAVAGELMPKPGVYAAEVLVGDARHPAVVNLGTNPTFVAAGALSLEAHLFDFEGDLYDRVLSVLFHARLRGEERFPSADALVLQIRRDIEDARAFMAQVTAS